MNAPQSVALIRPRTKSERIALLAGYAMALDMVSENGTEAAREWLREMAESEERIGGST